MSRALAYGLALVGLVTASVLALAGPASAQTSCSVAAHCVYKDTFGDLEQIGYTVSDPTFVGDTFLVVRR